MPSVLLYSLVHLSVDEFGESDLSTLASVWFFFLILGHLALVRRQNEGKQTKGLRSTLREKISKPFCTPMLVSKNFGGHISVFSPKWGLRLCPGKPKAKIASVCFKIAFPAEMASPPTTPPGVENSPGRRSLREQCWSSQASVDLHTSSWLAVDTMLLYESNRGPIIVLNCTCGQGKWTQKRAAKH